jgi:antitoxin (DNA-binding transcriptional repressor) of toxin-antitoxin stability system
MYKVHQAKTNLSRLIKEACAGRKVIIARGDQPVVRLVPIPATGKKRNPGRIKGQIRISAGFFKPMSRKERKAWGLE